MAKQKSLRSLEALVAAKLVDAAAVDQLKAVTEQFSIAITPTITARINADASQDPVAMQFVPTAMEAISHTNERDDPIGDEKYSKVEGIIHRYPDRLLLLPLVICPVYCRFCFRKESLNHKTQTLSAAALENAFAYIEAHSEVWEVIITGGDPLFLKPAVLTKIMRRLASIEHVEIVRIHTRVPVVDPERIDANMLTALKSDKTTYIILHTNHAQEFSSAAKLACAKIIDAGIPMLSQTVLLKGINDNIEALSDLMRLLVKLRIKPYYLHHADLTRGTAHFRTSIAQGRALVSALRGRFSGLCQPTYVIDIPGGFGKVPIGPSYVTTTGNGEYELTDRHGHCHHYEDD